MQTHRGRNKRDKQRERGARETNRKRQWSDLETQITPQQRLGWCSTAITESSTVCVCEREGQRQRQTGTEEREIGLRGRDQREGKRKRGIRKKKIYYLNNTNFKNCCSKLKTARGVHKIQHLNPLK